MEVFQLLQTCMPSGRWHRGFNPKAYLWLWMTPWKLLIVNLTSYMYTFESDHKLPSLSLTGPFGFSWCLGIWINNLASLLKFMHGVSGEIFPSRLTKSTHDLFRGSIRLIETNCNYGKSLIIITICSNIRTDDSTFL